MTVVLAFDTSTEAVGLGVLEIEGDCIDVLVDESVPARRQANQILLSLVVDRLHAHGLAITDVDEIIVGRGPGSFTGVRIGVAAAKGLAQGLGVPLYGASTTEAIAVGLGREMENGLIGVVGDAMRGEVYPALFEIADGRVISSTADRVAKPVDVANEWAETVTTDLILTGNGLAKYRSVFEDALGDRARFAPEEAWYPTGTGLLDALRREWCDSGEMPNGDANAVLPVYTRLSDAEENERARSSSPQTLPPSGVTARPNEKRLARDSGRADE